MLQFYNFNSAFKIVSKDRFCVYNGLAVYKQNGYT